MDLPRRSQRKDISPLLRVLGDYTNAFQQSSDAVPSAMRSERARSDAFHLRFRRVELALRCELSDSACKETRAKRAWSAHTEPDLNTKIAKDAKFQTIPIFAFLRGPSRSPRQNSELLNHRGRRERREKQFFRIFSALSAVIPNRT